jgi:signal transduction histidine kinase
VKLTSQAIDVGDLLDTTAKGMTNVLSERGVALVLEPATSANGLTVNGDPLRLRQVLVNLVDNAANASQSGAEVILRATAANDHVAIDIEDHGRGIGAEDLPKIFDPFFTTRPDGTGLGLAICHKVVRAHGGDIRVRSVVGGGSTFTVVLPAA